MDKKWYQKTFGIIALLILFFPIGLYLTWKYADWGIKTKWAITAVFGIFILVGALSGSTEQARTASQPTSTQTETKPTESPKPSSSELKAEVKFSDTAYQITNIEDKDWSNCRLEMNAGVVRGGYSYKIALIPPGSPVVIPFREFTKSDGTRFDPNETKHQNLSLSCEVNGKQSYGYYGE